MALQFFESPFHATNPSDTADNMILHVDSVILIRDIIEKQGWTQAEAARNLGIEQSCVSDIINGKTEEFSLDFLTSLIDSLSVFYIEDSITSKNDLP